MHSTLGVQFHNALLIKTTDLKHSILEYSFLKTVLIKNKFEAFDSKVQVSNILLIKMTNLKHLILEYSFPLHSYEKDRIEAFDFRVSITLLSN